jgi:hypothetical protein
MSEKFSVTTKYFLAIDEYISIYIKSACDFIIMRRLYEWNPIKLQIFGVNIEGEDLRIGLLVNCFRD